MSEPVDALFEKVRAELSSVVTPNGLVMLDAATGAGHCALPVAGMVGSGRLVTVENDPKARTDWAKAKVKAAGLSDRAEFVEADIARLTMFEDKTCDLVASRATLSTMGLNVVDGMRELFRVAKLGALLAVSDVLPQPAPTTLVQRNSVEAWRLSKAIAVLAGEPHYEEFPLDWVCRRLQNPGFVVEWCAEQDAWPAASTESLDEYLATEEWEGVADPAMRDFFRARCLVLKDRVRREGMGVFAPRYALCARRPAGEGPCMR
ncbi:MAG: methyltransferase domain-containing protein [Verrucomicrobia bacterium]|nr:methyltransferase domain-containing protein [Verrucomicrobiota bacterium]